MIKYITSLCIIIITTLSVSAKEQNPADSVGFAASNVKLKSVIISSNRYNSQRVMSSERMIQSVPSIMGENDIVKFIITLPGVSSTSILDPNFYVRGGDGYENRFLVNGFPVASPQHLSGMMSLFDPFILHSSTLYKSGYPAQYSGVLSSYLNMFPAIRRDTTTHGEVMIGLIASSAKVAIPLGEKMGELSLAFRRSYLKEIFQIVNKIDTDIYTVPYSFYDTSLNYNNQLSQNWSLNLFGIYSNDDLIFDSSNTIEFQWSSYSLNATAKRSTNNSTLTLAAGVWGNRNDGQYESYLSSTTSCAIDNNRLQATYNYYLNNHLTLSAGTSCEHRCYNYAAMNVTTHTFTSDLWSSVMYKSSNKSSVEMGLNLEQFSGLTNSLVVQPRVQAIYQISKRCSMTADYARTVQYDTQATLLSLPSPADMMLPIAEGNVPISCDQISLGANYTLNNHISINGAIFYRNFNNVKEVSTTSLAQKISQVDDITLYNGEGAAQGAEVEFCLSYERFMLRANYTFTDSWREFAQINDGEQFTPTYDVKHNISASCELKIAENWRINALWQYSSGRYVTFPIGVALSNNIATGTPSVIPIYNDRNNFQLPATHRLDLSVEYSIKRWGVNAGAYNAYNQANISFVNYVVKQYDTYTSYIAAQGVNILPLIPYISASYKW